LPIWKSAGRIEDLTRNIRKPMYAPSDAKIAAVEFAEKFREDYQFILNVLRSNDDELSLIAFDIIHYMSADFSAEGEVPSEILNCETLLPPAIISEIDGLREYQNFSGTTIGEFIYYEHCEDLEIRFPPIERRLP